MSDLYGDLFYDRITPSSTDSAKVVLPIVFERFNPQSIVDLGCGSGAWLSIAIQLGVEDVTGVDGPWVTSEALRIPVGRFIECDLSKGDPHLERRFDMAFSTEVAEHLPPDRSATFVDLLCSCADVVMFSAAIPQQGGVGHDNEQWQSFWVDHFHRNGYGVIDIVRPATWTDGSVAPWYRQNLLVFVKGAADEAHMLDVVHPYFVIRGLAVPKSRVVRALRSRLRPARSWVRGRL